MKDAAWFVLTAFFAIPIGGLIVTLIAARISRIAARETALLAAAQRRRDAEISQLRGALDDLLAAAAAVVSFTWCVDKETRLRTKLSKEEWQENLEFFERAAVTSGRVRAIAPSMPTDELREKYFAVDRLIMDVLAGGDGENPRDAWEEDLETEPNTITQAMDATAEEIKRLYATYPSEL